MGTVNSYRFNSETEPTDAQLSAIMKEAADDARKSNEAATVAFFAGIRQHIRAAR